MAKESKSGRFTGRPQQQQGSEWVEANFRLDSGQDITVSTKFPEKARLMAGLVDVPAVIEVDHVTNEFGGQTRHRFYMGKVVSSGFEQPEDTGIDIVPATSSENGAAGKSGRDWEPHELRAWRIALGAGAKMAVASIPYLEARGYETSMDAQKQVALAWALWIFENGKETPQPQLTVGAYTDPGPETRSYQDEDIPF